MTGFVDISIVLKPAIYLLWRNGKVVYVGQSRCPLIRLATHRSLAGRRPLPWMKSVGIKFDQVSILPTALDDLDLVEKHWIKFFAPIHNKRHVPPRKLKLD